jgi:Flp pilus assembly protein TadB
VSQSARPEESITETRMEWADEELASSIRDRRAAASAARRKRLFLLDLGIGLVLALLALALANGLALIALALLVVTLGSLGLALFGRLRGRGGLRRRARAGRSGQEAPAARSRRTTGARDR